MQIREDVADDVNAALMSQSRRLQTDEINKGFLLSDDGSQTPMVSITTPINPYLQSMSRHCSAISQQLAIAGARVGKTTG